MTTPHLTEEQLQDLLLGRANSQHEEHLQHCDSCKEQLEVYRMLFSELKHQSLPAFDFNVTNLVMKNLPSTQKKKMGLPLIVGMFLMITAAALVYYYQHEIRSIFKGIDVLIAWITVISLTTGAASILFDQYRLYRNKMQQINNYSVK